MSWIIKAENISKMYRLGAISSASLQEDLKRSWYKFRGKEDPFLKVGEANQRDVEGSDYVWALKDINFELERGEVLGIIGKNGAGKSTLLKLLSQVTKPTTGKIQTRGRIASLLEVGTGFHPELSGRENIFLNGAILGMKKHEIKSKFDEIVEFSGCARYIDTPVKRYSSGMYVRLAFAVAAHLEPEILVVDEVLAVGDAEFQKKAIGKMKDVSEGQGRTVLFVSHNINMINRLCKKGLLLEHGTVKFSGNINDTLETYLNTSTSGTVGHYNGLNDDKEGDMKIMDASLISQNQIIETPIDVKSELFLEYTLQLSKDIKLPQINFIIKNMYDEAVFFVDRKDDLEAYGSLEKGTYKFKIDIPNPLLKPGQYTITIGNVNHDNGNANHYQNILGFEVIDNNSLRPMRPGHIYQPLKWNTIKL